MSDATPGQPQGEGGDHASPGGDDAIRVEGLRKEYGPLVAVDDVSFTIRSNEFFTILGPSGSGKSTLLKMLAGIETPTKGQILIDGRDVSDVPPNQRPTTMIFQDLALFPHKSVYENLAFGLKMKGVSRDERRREAAEMLIDLGLDGYGDNAIDELSGGEKQRVAIGRSLLANPEYLLLDEPLASLDRRLKDELQLELRAIQDEMASTFVYVTHDQDIALTASDRVAVMKDGEFVQIGKPSEIYNRPVNRFVAQFIGDTNLIGGRIEKDGDGTARFVADEFEATVVADYVEGLGDIFLSLRPEEITIGEPAISLENTYKAKVVDRIYYGDRTRFEIEFGSLPLLIQESNRKDLSLVADGETVTIGWSVDDGFLIEE